MKLLTWYIARTFLKYWLLCLLAFFSFVTVANLLGNLEKTFSSIQGLLIFIEETLRGMPEVLDILLPMTVLLATIFTFTSFSRSSELVAMNATGIGPVGHIMPVFGVLVFVSLFAYINQNYLYIQAKKGTDRAVIVDDSVRWQASGNSVYYLGRVKPESSQIQDLLIITWRQPFFQIQSYEAIESVEKTGDEQWRFSNRNGSRNLGETWSFDHTPTGVISRADFPELLIPVQLNAHHMPRIDLYRKIGQLESQGKPVDLYWLEIHQKLSAMLAPFVLAWFGAPFSKGHHRKGRSSGEMVLGILGGLVFVIATRIFFTMGTGMLLPPLVATWGVNVLFFAAGGLLLLRER